MFRSVSHDGHFGSCRKDGLWEGALKQVRALGIDWIGDGESLELKGKTDSGNVEDRTWSGSDVALTPG